MVESRFSTWVISKQDVSRWLHDQVDMHHPSILPLVGDRFSCIDEAVAIGGELIIGIATIAAQGEQMSGEPTIVAVFIQPPFRGQGYGVQVFCAAVARCRERGLVPVRFDAIDPREAEIIRHLPDEYQQNVRLVDMSNPMFAALGDIYFCW